MQYSSGMCIIVKESKLFDDLRDINWSSFYLNSNFDDYIKHKIKSGDECIIIDGEWGCPENKLEELFEMVRDRIPESILLGHSTSINSDPYYVAMYSMPNDDVCIKWGQKSKSCYFQYEMGLEEVQKWLYDMEIDLSEDEISNIFNFFGVEKAELDFKLMTYGVPIFEDAFNSKLLADGVSTFEDVLRSHFKIDNEKLNKVIDSDITSIARILIVCNDNKAFENLQDYLVEHGENIITSSMIFEKDDLRIWGIIENQNYRLSWLMEELNIIEKFNGQIMVVCDSFEVDWDDDGYQDGEAIAYFGNEEKYVGWYYDVEPMDNCKLNISDLYEYISTYDMFLDEKEISYIEQMHLNSCRRKE